MSKQPFFTGLDNMKKATTSGGELRLGDKEGAIIKFLDDAEGEHPIAQYYSHYINKDLGGYPCVEDIYGTCPLCEAGVSRRYQMLANVAVIDGNGCDVRFIRKGREFVETITPYLEEYGTLTDRYYKITGESRSVGSNNYIGFNLVPIDKLPDGYKEPDEDNLRRIDWNTFLITPKLEALEKVAEQISHSDQ